MSATRKAGSKTGLTLEKLAEVRRKSDAISVSVRDSLTGYLETLRPLVAPARVFGRFAGGSETAGAGKALKSLAEQYEALAGPPFMAPREFDSDWLKDVSDRLVLHPWDYTHKTAGSGDARDIMITSPVSWILTFHCEYTPQQLRQVLSGQTARRAEFVRTFLTSVLAVKVALEQHPGIAALLTGLRYTVEQRQVPEFGQLTVTTISSCLPAFLPGDDLLLAATGFSGVDAFNEVIDLDAIESLTDPLKEELAGLA
jgi:hypothetical protein